MRKHLWFFIVAAALMMAVVMLPVFRPGGEPSRPGEDMPWQATPTADGSITVFGLTLGRSTLRDAIAKLGRRFEAALFREPDGRVSLEAYFRDAVLGGLNARLVAGLALDQETLQAMLARSGQGQGLAGGVERFPVADADAPAVLAAPIASLTYVPYATLSEELVRERFGEPAERIVADDGNTHWLYPDKGLDLVLGADGEALLQYLPPRDFERLRAPLVLPGTGDDAT